MAIIKITNRQFYQLQNIRLLDSDLNVIRSYNVNAQDARRNVFSVDVTNLQLFGYYRIAVTLGIPFYKSFISENCFIDSKINGSLSIYLDDRWGAVFHDRFPSPVRRAIYPDILHGDEVVRTVSNLPIAIATLGTAKHVGIYAGDDTVVDVGGDRGEKISANHLQYWGVESINWPRPSTVQAGESIAQTARSNVGRKWNYDPVDNNCQHFSNWCRTGLFYSYQSGGNPTRDMNFSNGFMRCLYGAVPGAVLSGAVSGAMPIMLSGAVVGCAISAIDADLNPKPRFGS